MSLLDFLIFIPILAAVATAFGAPARLAAVGTAGINLAIGLILAFRFDAAAGQNYQFVAKRMLSHSPELSFAVGIDGMSLILVLLTVLVTFCAVWIQPPAAAPRKLYYISSLLISAGALGAFVSTDLLFFYAFHELALIPTFLMIGLLGNGNRERRMDAAWKITVYLGLGSMVLLAGLAWLVMQASGDRMTFDMVALKEAAPKIDGKTQEWIFLTLLIGFGILVSLFPFHSWAAQAYATAPAPTAMLHAGVLKKFGLYGILRVAVPFLPQGAGAEWVNHLLIWMLLGNIIVIGLVTIAQRELDLVLGNSSVMHMGYAFLGIASGTTIGYTGAVLLMFAHGVSIALLFGLTAALREKSGTMVLDRLGGFAKSMPFLGLAFAMGSFASIGLPGFANFAAEILVFFSGFKNYAVGQPFGFLQVATVLGLWGVVMSAVYMLRAFRAVFTGPAAADAEPVSGDIPLPARVPFILLLIALLAVGFVPSLLTHFLSGTFASP